MYIDFLDFRAFEKGAERDENWRLDTIIISLAPLLKVVNASPLLREIRMANGFTLQTNGESLELRPVVRL